MWIGMNVNEFWNYVPVKLAYKAFSMCMQLDLEKVESMIWLFDLISLILLMFGYHVWHWLG